MYSKHAKTKSKAIITQQHIQNINDILHFICKTKTKEWLLCEFSIHIPLLLCVIFFLSNIVSKHTQNDISFGQITSFYHIFFYFPIYWRCWTIKNWHTRPKYKCLLENISFFMQTFLKSKIHIACKSHTSTQNNTVSQW